MDRSTLIWMLGLCMLAGAAAYELNGFVAAVGSVGMVLFVVGLADDIVRGGD